MIEKRGDHGHVFETKLAVPDVIVRSKRRVTGESWPAHLRSDLINFLCLNNLFLLESGESLLLIVSFKPIHQLFHPNPLVKRWGSCR
jgi:hypothetical protein